MITHLIVAATLRVNRAAVSPCCIRGRKRENRSSDIRSSCEGISVLDELAEGNKAFVSTSLLLPLPLLLLLLPLAAAATTVVAEALVLATAVAAVGEEAAVVMIREDVTLAIEQM